MMSEEHNQTQEFELKREDLYKDFAISSPNLM